MNRFLTEVAGLKHPVVYSFFKTKSYLVIALLPINFTLFTK